MLFIEALGLQQVDLLGFSLGGHVARGTDAPLGRASIASRDLAARYLWRYGLGVSVDVIRAGYEAANSGDLEPLVSLFDAQMEWRGRRRLPWFWRPPS